ncbi:MAG: glycerophosphodiester phosphodiesterase family protein [Candidatus Thorarchaeota archaeon]|nr:glycerophosphodiester phosphodiesterase family protein [Candidatus Thorarchaeota archaeon]
MQEPIIIGHRGAAGLAPENTLLSFHTALNLGVPMIELDIHETLDGHLVCIHDGSVDRTTNGVGNVAELTLQELRLFDAGMGEKIPLLHEVLDMARNRMKVNIELKTIGVEKSMIDLVVSRKMINDVMVSSFFHATLLTTKEINSGISTAVLFDKPKSDLVSYTIELGSDAINPRFSFVSNVIIEDAHRNHLKIYPWTVNDRSQMLELLTMGVDGIITDYPNLGLDVVKDFSNSRF